MPNRPAPRWLIRALLLALAVATLAGCATPAGTQTGTPTGAAPTSTATTLPATATLTPSSTPSQASAGATAPAQGSATTPGSSAGSSAYSFPLLAPGATLPSEAYCAAHIQRSSWEPRPQNTAANQRVPSGAQLAALSVWGAAMGLDPRADQLRQQMTGGFTGTTDEILQWVACKWGVPVDIVRAEAVIESSWLQSTQGDQTSDQSVCPPGTWNGGSCNQSYGILQIKYQYNTSAWPMSRDDTAFSAEYVYGIIRACYEGWTTYLRSMTPQPGYPAYHAGDLWGCLGRWYSGGWYDQGAIDYIAKVKAVYDQKPWRSPGF
ncbi:MAG TPA: hypothetical protein VFU60_05745 [Ktedonobacterales bacterium]|nr:hypothetical protein [Ktedonobacterales bacterium]